MPPPEVCVFNSRQIIRGPDEIRGQVGSLASHPRLWQEFRKRCLAELDHKSEVLDELRRRLREGPVTFAAKDEEHNSAIVLKEFLERGPRP